MAHDPTDDFVTIVYIVIVIAAATALVSGNESEGGLGHFQARNRAGGAESAPIPAGAAARSQLPQHWRSQTNRIAKSYSVAIAFARSNLRLLQQFESERSVPAYFVSSVMLSENVPASLLIAETR